MLVGRNTEFFRQKEKPVGLIKPSDGGDGGYSDRNGSSSSYGVALPGMRSVRSPIALSVSWLMFVIDARQDVSHDGFTG
jgi:hypothetical protein